MNYFGRGGTDSSTQAGVLLINLGAPSRPTYPNLRRYLSEFLQDPRVIELPRLLRWLLVKGIIINVRARGSARNYRKIWTEKGSPLLLNTQQLAHELQSRLGENYRVEVGMRYGEPSIESALQRLNQAGIHKLTVLPLYPQYSGSTGGSSFDAVAQTYQSFRRVPQFCFIDGYFDHPKYIQAIAQSIHQHWQKHGQAQKLLMSFHGLPQRYIDNGDPYQAQCEHAAQAIAEHLGLNKDQWMLVYQSRLGAQPWLQPYCDQTLQSLPDQGINSVDIVCPGFSVDCLETLEEIDMQNREGFIQAGGKAYHYIECLNAKQAHVDLLQSLLTDYAPPQEPR